MTTTSYPSPVDQLLTYSTCEDIDITSHKQWPDYLQLGFGPEHIPDLLRLAMDPTYGASNSEDPKYCAPVHAWRILGLLRAEAAIEPLITLTEDPGYADIASDELPEVYALIGPPAIPTLKAFLAETSHTTSARIDASSSIERIGKMHPETRTECIAIITSQLELFAENNPQINAFLILNLKELQVPEAIPLIKQAFDADAVDQFIIGTYEDVQVAFGLKERSEVSRMAVDSEDSPGIGTQVVASTRTRAHGGGSHNKNKAKYKMAKQSRKKNKKRK